MKLLNEVKETELNELRQDCNTTKSFVRFLSANADYLAQNIIIQC